MLLALIVQESVARVLLALIVQSVARSVARRLARVLL